MVDLRVQGVKESRGQGVDKINFNGTLINTQCQDGKLLVPVDHKTG
jgi:hypothetical protein